MPSRRSISTLLPALLLAACPGSGPGTTDSDSGVGTSDAGLHDLGPSTDRGAADLGRFDARVVRTFDVVIVGAGTGGTAAAIQAARMGARVALLEESTWVGGQATSAGVSSMDVSSAREADYGLYKELIDRVRTHYAGLGKSISTCYWSGDSQCFEPRVGKDKLLELLRAAPSGKGSLELFTQVSVAAVLKSGQAVTGVRTSGGEIFQARVLVDATEHGDLLPLAGVRYRVGNATSDAPNAAACLQDLTYVAIAKKYPKGLPTGLAFSSAPPGYAEAKPHFERVIRKGGTSWFGLAPYYPYDAVTHAAYRGTPDSTGAGSYTAANAATSAAITKTGINWANDHPALNLYNPAPGVTNPTLPVRYLEDRTYRAQVDCEARLKTLQFLYYLQTDLGEPLWSVANDEGYDPAPCPNIPAAFRSLERHFPLYPYVRESRRMIGSRTLTARHLVNDPGVPRSKTLEPSAIAVGGYANDLHNCSSDATLESALETRADVSSGRVFQIPLEAFLPETLDGFLPAEKNFSQSRLANGATRLQPTTMATGQAMGALAALAVARGIAPRAVKPVLVQNALVKAGARLSLYRFDDMPPGHALWPAVELVSARGVMVGGSDGRFRVADPLSRAETAIVLARLLGLATSTPPATPSFQDVPADHFAYGAIEAIKRAGLTGGCSTSPPRYCPDEPLTRAMLASFLARGLALDLAKAPTTPYYTDVPRDHLAFAAVQVVTQAGLLPGCATARHFCPAEAVSRGAMAEAARAALLHGL
ncbi:MAG: FAD-dependent oxidoreductase [Deltaproteobacteria bacterium]|nr:FAD-dependent oxidoreductase [Deltaproteobacteria bacterium]